MYVPPASALFSSTHTPVQSHSSEVTSSIDEIKKAKEMLDQGVISDAEFNELKSKILSQGRSI